MRCPICQSPVPAPEPGVKSFRPFCSDRCKLVDLGKWFSESYAIPGPPADPSEVERADAPDRDA